MTTNAATTPRLAGKRALITGAGAGIGQASALVFAREGAHVACADISRTSAEDTVAQIRAAGGSATAIEADVRRGPDIERMVRETLAAFGRIDVLFNNAGIGVRGKVHELDESDWDLVMDTTLKSTFLCSKAVVPHFLDQGSGTIVNNASSLGLLASPAYGAYCAAKAGVILLTKTMALDYGPAIRVNCICPGATDTPRMRRNIAAAADPAARLRATQELNCALNRLAEPIEIAHAALFLASDESSFCTGTALAVDGGQTSDA